MEKIKEVIIVEGRYDKNAVSQAVDAMILETSGFSIFSDREKQKLIQKLAEERGIIVFTDSDSAGFLIRNFVKGAVPPDRVKHAYIPDIYGKERRKAQHSKEGKIGVEGMSKEVIISALKSAGGTFVDTQRKSPPITPYDLYETGISGGRNSAEKRKHIYRNLDLPEHLSTAAFIDILNMLYEYDEAKEILSAKL